MNKHVFYFLLCTCIKGVFQLRKSRQSSMRCYLPQPRAPGLGKEASLQGPLVQICLPTLAIKVKPWAWPLSVIPIKHILFCMGHFCSEGLKGHHSIWPLKWIMPLIALKSQGLDVHSTDDKKKRAGTRSSHLTRGHQSVSIRTGWVRIVLLWTRCSMHSNSTWANISKWPLEAQEACFNTPRDKLLLQAGRKELPKDIFFL